MMSPLPPRIGKVNVVRGDGRRRHAVRDDTGGVGSDDADVRELRGRERIAKAARAPERALDAEEISVRSGRCRGEQKGSALRPDFYLDRSVIAEELTPKCRQRSSTPDVDHRRREERLR